MVESALTELRSEIKHYNLKNETGSPGDEREPKLTHETIRQPDANLRAGLIRSDFGSVLPPAHRRWIPTPCCHSHRPDLLGGPCGFGLTPRALAQAESAGHLGRAGF